MIFNSLEQSWAFAWGILLFIVIRRLVAAGVARAALQTVVDILILFGLASKADAIWIIGGVFLSYGLSFFVRRSRGKLITGVSILVLLAWFIAGKYPPLQTILNQLMLDHNPKSSIGLLSGFALSYAFFRSLHFLVESRRGHIEKKSLFGYAHYVTFFPTLASGPIERYHRFIEQDQRPKGLPSLAHAESGIYRLLLGAVKRGVLLAPLALYIDSPELLTDSFGTIVGWAVFGLLYYLYLYLDFSGFADLAIGAGQLSGYEISENFEQPYRATNLADFWRRWHITLSTMVRDYVFLPWVRLPVLSRALPRDVVTYSGYLLGFVAMGLWHGGTIGFLLWGLWHGLGLVLRKVWLQAGFDIPAIASYLVTHSWVAIGWVFFGGGLW